MNNTDDDEQPCCVSVDYGFPRVCAGCGYEYLANHCIHDGVQNRCRQCGWLDPGRQSPLQFLGGEDQVLAIARDAISRSIENEIG